MMRTFNESYEHGSLNRAKLFSISTAQVLEQRRVQGGVPVSLVYGKCSQ